MKQILNSAMLLIVLLTTSLALFVAPSQGQILECGTPEPTAEEASIARKRVEAWRLAGGREIMTIATIPVFFHVVTSGGSGDVTDQQLLDQIDALNDGFANTDFRFAFCGVDRTNNASWSANWYGSPQEMAMKQALAVTPEHVLNFYVCYDPRDDVGGVVHGYARFPWDYHETEIMHGVVVKYNALPGGSAPDLNLGDVGVHEVGHYAGLYHTFRWGCTPPGDEVDDTPYEVAPVYGGCPPPYDTCPEDPENDPIHNFMDYTNDICRTHFTAGQAARMQTQMSAERPSIVDGMCITVNQKLEDGTPTGDIGRWNGSSFNPRFNSGARMIFSSPSIELLHGDTNIVSNQKYQAWSRFVTPDDDVRNHHRFDVTDASFPTSLTAQFNPTQSDVRIKTALLDAPGITGGTIQFRDPWYIDINDPSYGNHRRNQGMIDAQLHTRQSVSPEGGCQYIAARG